MVLWAKKGVKLVDINTHTLVDNEHGLIQSGINYCFST
jgi:hypothetical protein